MENKNVQLLIIPGLGGSDENHWQSFWLKDYSNSIKVIQEDWNKPNLEIWLKKLNDTILTIDAPIILVAHSLAVSLVLHWASKYTNPNIKGALLVAPADVDSPTHTPEIVRGFAPMPVYKLPFASTVITSDNDDFVSVQRAEYFAQQWKSDFVNIGSIGHINSTSNLKSWKEGQQLLEELIHNVKGSSL